VFSPWNCFRRNNQIRNQAVMVKCVSIWLSHSDYVFGQTLLCVFL
jgi:hypothetical protein